MHVRLARFLLTAGAVFFIAGSMSVPASEVVYFVNGSSMPVLNHRIDKGTITLELSPGATIAFPAENVERIESNGRPVWTPATIGDNANRVVSGVERGGAITMAGGDFSTSAAARRRERFLANPAAEFVNPGEMARDGEIGSPVKGLPGRNLRRMSGPGAPRPDDPANVRRMGDRLVIEPVRGPTNHAGQPIVGIGGKSALQPLGSDGSGEGSPPDADPTGPDDGTPDAPADDSSDGSSGTP